MSRPKREPEVIVFEEPTFGKPRKDKDAAREREKFLCGNVFSNEGETRERKRTRDDSTIDFKATLREVRALAASSLSGKERQRFEEEQIRELGGKAPKPVYMPYPYYQQMMRVKRRKEKEREEQLRLTQVGTRKMAESKKKVKGRGRWRDNMKSLEPSVGKFSGGVLKLSDQDIHKVKKSRLKH